MEARKQLKIYNTLTNSMEEFVPMKDGEVKIYVCGPTVYDYCHIGNARPLVFFDVVHRYFKLAGYNVTFISNFTDIDDKIINKAIEENISEEEVALKYIKAYNDDVNNLNCLSVDIRCKVTDYLEEISSFIKNLVDTGYAYQVGTDVYFRVEKINEYGQLSNNSLDQLNAGERIEANDQKEHPADFVLWKNTGVGISYESPFGPGRPGWHTECTVMIKSLTDGKVDIHGGGNDLCFPHHENEIAQSIAYDKTNLANYWMHNGLLNLNNVKMSKSLGNYLLMKDFISQYGGNVLRLSLLQTHYRSIINLNDDLINNSVKLNEKIEAIFKKLSLAKQLNNSSSKSFGKYFEIIENDFNTANIITYLLDLIKEINLALRNNSDVVEFYAEFMDVLYLLGLKYDYPVLTDDDLDEYLQWEQFRNNKDFDSADIIRVKLESKGII